MGQELLTAMVGTRQSRYDLKQVLQVLRSQTAKDLAVGEAKGEYKAGSLTYEDYAAMPAKTGYILQLIDGHFIREPGPVLQHQRVSRRLQRVLEDYFFQTNPQGELFNLPIDLVLSEHSTVQPDLVFISDTAKLTNPKYIDVVPELVVEILSPSSKHTDTMKKVDLYLRHGVLHYWIVEPEEGTIKSLKLAAGKYVIVTAEDADFEHPDFPGLRFNLAKLVKKPG